MSKYDVRSARGGRGGVVTSVTALWSNMSPTAGMPMGERKDPPRQSRLSTGFSTPVANHKSDRPQARSPSTPSPPNLLQAANKAKPTSSPGVINRTLGRPVLSPAASLDPAMLRSKPASSPVEQMERPTVPPYKSEQLFGQAKLRDLIRKYQNG